MARSRDWGLTLKTPKRSCLKWLDGIEEKRDEIWQARQGHFVIARLAMDASTGTSIKDAWVNILPIVEIRPESGFAIVELAAMNIGRSRVRVADRYVHLLEHMSPQLPPFDL